MYTITIEMIKTYGEYQGWCEENQAYLYKVNTAFYKWNGKGVEAV